MSARYRALIWEQNRVASRVAGMCLAMGLLLQIVLWCMARLDFLRLADAEDGGRAAYFFATLGTAAVLVLRQDRQGHLVTAFESHLRLLPMGTLSLVTIPFLTRATYITLVCALSALACLVLNGSAIPLAYIAFPIECYLISQAFAWSRRTITGTEYLLPLALVVVLALLTENTHGEFLEATRVLATVILPAGFVLIAGVSYGVAYLGVSLERREARIGLPTLAELWEDLRSRADTSERPFASAFAAQLWCERKRTALLLPACTLVLLGVGSLGALVITDLRSELHWLAWVFPPCAMVAAAFPAALIGAWPRSGYSFVLPSPPRRMAYARLVAVLESILSTLAVVVLFSLAARWLFGQTEINFYREVYRSGEASLLEITGILLAPAVLGSVAAWCIMASPRMLTTLLMVGGTAGLVLVLLGNLHAANLVSEDVGLWLVLASGLGIIVERFVACRRSRAVPAYVLLAALIAWPLLAATMWSLGLPTPHPGLAYVCCLVPAGLVIAPLLSVPVEVYQRRSR